MQIFGIFFHSVVPFYAIETRIDEETLKLNHNYLAFYT